MNKLRMKKGFTLIELMIVVAIIGILAAIAIPQFAQLISKSQEGATKGNLGTIRSALSIYYGDTEGRYPEDDASPTAGMSSLTAAGKYLQVLPMSNIPRTLNSTGHTTTREVVTGYIGSAASPLADNKAGWLYDNNTADSTWGNIVVNCSHSDLRGSKWTSY